jgi:type 1 glutamine amidotransferase
MKNLILPLILLLVFSCTPPESKNERTTYKALILDGSNNHYVWPKTTFMLKSYLEETGLFSVEIFRPDSVWLGIKYNPNRPEAYESFITEFPTDKSKQLTSNKPLESFNAPQDFEQYDVIISNLGASTPHWPQAAKNQFETYMKNGGGLVVIHAANNAWGDWEAFNEMIGLGAWGGRDSTSGPFVYYDQEGKIQKNDSADVCGSHGLEHEFIVTTREPDHPIMKDLPTTWLHTRDELYDRMRGPFNNATILATAYSDVEKNAQPWEPSVSGTGQNVPMLMTVNYGEGRVFHSTLGHFDYSMECVGFITTFQRGTEWAASGKVTQTIPADFPSENQVSARPWRPAE